MTDDADPSPFRAVLTSAGRTRVLTVRRAGHVRWAGSGNSRIHRGCRRRGGLVVDLADAVFLSSSAITNLVQTSEHLPQRAVALVCDATGRAASDRAQRRRSLDAGLT
ncbi:hypothetical protein ACFULT_05170 [Rhodococcus sp. NPDC057297]|uniref:hypothetical protein n=1 Tax=Rhodococcus sp. NPDC057297 TaxID=3346090 RepID=UPI00363896A0